MSTPAKGLVVGGKYRLEKPLGRGGMGSVWLAYHTQLHTPVAVKFIAALLAESASARSRFEREAKAAAILKSPHVVQVFDYGIDDDLPYLVMELVEGEDLADRFKRERRIDVRAFAPLLAQMAKGLQKAHEAGIVHRDLKPRNVFIARGDEGEVVKILDFGIAKISGEAGETKTGELIGSPHYMSPEQAHGAKTVDHRSDLWSLAAIAYRAITGRNAYEGEGMGEVLVKVSTTKPEKATDVAPDLPKELDVFFDKAFARDPKDRFQTARELATEFFNVIGEPSFGAWFSAPSQRMSSADLAMSAAPVPVKATLMSAPVLTALTTHDAGGATPAPMSATPSPMLTPIPPSFIAASTAQATADAMDTGYFGREKQRSKRVAVGVGLAALFGIGAVLAVFLMRSDPVEEAVGAALATSALPPVPLESTASAAPSTTAVAALSASAPAAPADTAAADEAPGAPKKKDVSSAKSKASVTVQSAAQPTATSTAKKRVRLGY